LVRSGRGSALVAWREVLESAAEAGVELDRGQTPRAVVLRLSRARGISDAGRAALERLCAAVELSEFGPPGTTGAAPSLADDAELVVLCLLAGLDADRRARAHLLAPSLVSGTRDWLRRR
ncbi:MAG TPA: DUF4129 domain-containing protein, partial [Terrimesophilobacter sp.]|nr:DUF4129 domain-containing protein [Terrimesophilobacter sp.]